MGKIVKAASVTAERYVVAIPHIETALDRVRESDGEMDARFAASFGAEVVSRNGVSDEPVETEAAQPSIDWHTLQADAEAIVDRASGDARAILEGAQTAALDIVASTDARVASIEAQAHKTGYDAGFEDGKAAADAQMREMVTTLHGLMEGIRDQRRATMESAEPELVRLAMSIAERVVHQHIDDDLNVVVENVRSALTRLVSREVVTLRVNPADLETMRQHRDAIVAVSDVEHLRIVEDQRVDRGGVVVETDAGTIDAKIATQLREARRAIRADADIAS